jgi:hypothetical protein
MKRGFKGGEGKHLAELIRQEFLNTKSTVALSGRRESANVALFDV